MALIKAKSIEKVILRELVNNEAFYTYDIDDTMRSLADYDVTREEVIAVFNKNRNRYQD